MMNGVTTGAIADRRRSFIGSAQTLMRTLPSFPSTRRTRSLAVNDQRKEVADESSASSDETTFQDNMALKMNWFHGGLGTSSLVWPGMLMMCLAVIGGFSYVAALSSDETTSSEDGPIVVIPFAEDSASRGVEVEAITPPIAKAHTIVRCNSTQGITPACRSRIKDLKGRQSNPEIIVELYDDAQLNHLLSNLVMDLNVDAFYLKCMRRSLVEERAHKCRGGIPRPYNPDRHAKYHKQRTVGSTEFLRSDSGGSFGICYREFRLDFPGDVGIIYTEAKRETRWIAPFEKNSLWSNESGLYLIDSTATQEKLDSDVLQIDLKNGTARKVASVSMSPTRRATLRLRGFPSDFDFTLREEGLKAVRLSHKILGPFDGGDIAANTIIYIVHLLEKSRLCSLKSRIDTENVNVFKIDCKAGDNRPSLEECARKILYNKSRHRKDAIDIYVVSSSLYFMARFTLALDTVHGAFRDGRLWANYFLEKGPPEREHLAGRARRIFRGNNRRRRGNDGDMDNFQLATLTSFKAYPGGLAKFNDSLCAQFAVKYDAKEWTLWIDNKVSDDDFKLYRNCGTVHLSWTLAVIFVVRSNQRFNSLPNNFPHPLNGRHFELKKREEGMIRRTAMEKQISVKCDGVESTFSNDDGIGWDQAFTAIATNRNMSEEYQLDSSRTWAQLTS